MPHDFADLWHRSMIVTGERALTMVQAGASWREAAAACNGDIDTVRKAAAIFLASDLGNRQTAREGADAAQPDPATVGASTG